MNGEGEVRGLHSFMNENRPEKTCFQMIGEMTLPARGASIGFHVHHDNEEIYVAVAGRGLFTDNDGSAHAVLPGDVMLTRQGEGHAIANDGDGPFTFIAVIAA
jgi:mannose-6-phosphate isomerase-like protein (cupin superfamily)